MIAAHPITGGRMKTLSYTEVVDMENSDHDTYVINVVPNFLNYWTLAITPDDGDAVLYSARVKGDFATVRAEAFAWIESREQRKHNPLGYPAAS
jgi:hypothetical protein